MATLYFVDAEGGGWDEPLNWFLDSGWSTPANRIPVNGDSVVTASPFGPGPAAPVSLASLTLCAGWAVFGGYDTSKFTVTSLIIAAGFSAETWAGTAATTSLTVAGLWALTVTGSLGANVTIANNALITGDGGTIGNGCVIGTGCTLAGTMTVGTGASCASSVPEGWTFGNTYAQTAGDFAGIAGTSSFTGTAIKGGQTGNLTADASCTVSEETSNFTGTGTATFTGTPLSAATGRTIAITGVTTLNGTIAATIGEASTLSFGVCKVYGDLTVTRTGNLSGTLAGAFALHHAGASINIDGATFDITNVVLPSVGNVLTAQTFGLDGNDKTGTLALPAESDVRAGVEYGEGGDGSLGTMQASRSSPRGLWF